MSAASTNAAPGWGLRRLRIEECWRAGWTGASVRVGHLDTGVNAAHPALNGRVAAFAAFDDEGAHQPGMPPHDPLGHGTHTAGLICGRKIDDQTVGVAPDADLCSGMVIEGGHVLARVLSGIDWMFECDVRVVCLVLGIPGYHPLFERALAKLRRHGVLVVCPVGNGGRGCTCSPANYPGVLAVGATDTLDRVVRFSGDQTFRRESGSTKPDLVAPGASMFSARSGASGEARDGTSMAAACVAGVAALLFQAYPRATPDDVTWALTASAEPLREATQQRQGAGLVNPLGALQLLEQRASR